MIRIYPLIIFVNRRIRAYNYTMKNEITSKSTGLTDLNQHLFTSLFNYTSNGIIITDANSTIIDVNPAFTNITGYEKKEVIGKKPSILQSGRQSKKFYTLIWQQLLSKHHWHGEMWNRCKDGSLYPQRSTIDAVTDEENRITHYIAVLSDITDIKNKEQELTKLAYRDPLTGLANRALFFDRLQQTILIANRTKSDTAILFLDIDKFKPVNDTCGHHVGDLLLQEITSRLLLIVRETDTVSRFGGDEFVILLTNINQKNSIKIIAEKIINTIPKAYNIESNHIEIGVSVGVSQLNKNNNVDATTLLEQADAAMYEAKQKGGNCYCLSPTAVPLSYA
jgi:diguanylate cyclase (GGDEF)-like protein/PAS domain S-box-containing protein